jgi:polysaccharide biosynthesis protein PslG
VMLGLAMSVLLTSILGIAQVQPSFFGMHVNKLSSMPVEVPIGSLRLWDTATNWFQLCPTSDYSRCEWRHLDDWLAAAKSNGVSEVVYTFGKTPDWASSNPGGDCWRARPGVCYPPRDLTSDGGGTDEAFRHFVAAIVEHNQSLDSRTYARIKFWGICNEPTAKFFWRGSTAQLVRMAKDASEIIKKADPQALLLTPEPAANAKRNATDSAIDWFNDFLNRGGGQYADVIAFHVYANAVGDHPVPEDVVRIVQRVKAELARHPAAADKPLWITECSWGKSDETNWTSADDASAFLIRFLVVAASQGIERIYWYGWDVPTGTLSANGHPLPAASAYKEVRRWILGRSVTNCQSRSHVWSCDVGAPGYRARIVWDEEYRQSVPYDADGFVTYQSATGDKGTIDRKMHMLQVGNSPVLLEQTGATGR